MEDLLTELTIDILSRLPLKTIVHCKCVCKKWRNLLLQSSFVHLHLSRSPTGIIIHRKTDRNDPGILEWVEIEEEDDYPNLHHDPLMRLRLNHLAPILQKSEINLEGSVNGLICLHQGYPNFDNIYICNPVTREYMIVSRQQQYHREDCAQIVYGFGMSSLTGEYKVIQIIKYESSVSEAQVYTLGTCQWRSLGHVSYQFNAYYDGSYLNHHCYWIVCDEDAPENLCTFDFNKETFQLFLSPPVDVEAIRGGHYPFECLTILKGCLCKMDFYDYEYSQFTIWMMKEYMIKESWHRVMVFKQAISPYPDWLMCEPLNLVEGLNNGSIYIFHMLMLHGCKLQEFFSNKTIEITGFFKFSSFSSALAYHCLNSPPFRAPWLIVLAFLNSRILN